MVFKCVLCGAQFGWCWECSARRYASVWACTLVKGPSVIPSASGKVALKDITIFEDTQVQQVAMEVQALKEVSRSANASRKATGGLPDRQTPFVPHILRCEP